MRVLSCPDRIHWSVEGGVEIYGDDIRLDDGACLFQLIPADVPRQRSEAWECSWVPRNANDRLFTWICACVVAKLVTIGHLT